MSAPTADKYTAAQSWLKKDSGLIDLDLPSGATCQVRKLEMEDIIEMGLIDELDTFQSLFSDDEEGLPEDKEDELAFAKRLASGGNFKTLKKTIDKIVVQSVNQPKVEPVPDDGAVKDGVIYVDHIGFADKMAIFIVAFDGMSSMSTFREEPTSSVGTVAEKPVVEGNPI